MRDAKTFTQFVQLVGSRFKLMKTASFKVRRKAFSAPELLLIILILLVAVGLFLPILSRPNPRSGCRIRCTSNLKQIGLGFRMWAGDHAERFPMSVSTNQGGSLEFIGQSEVVRHYLAISNELNSPRILVCPCETKRKRTISFDTLTRNNVSYFVGLDAVETAPQSILSGDRNITTNGQLMSGILNLSTNTLGIWTKDIHMNGGNIGLGDGSAQQVTAIQFNEQVWKSDKFPVRLEIP